MKMVSKAGRHPHRCVVATLAATVAVVATVGPGTRSVKE